MSLRLRGITWSHSRGLLPMQATAQRFLEVHGVAVDWEARSLQAFADGDLEQLAARYDLLVIDHPWAGFASSSGILLPMDAWLPVDFLHDQAANTVGPSHRSYASSGHQWALAIDAATPVASWRPDRLFCPPQTWEEVLVLAGEGRVLLPGIPIDTLMNFYMFCIAEGSEPFADREEVVDRDTGHRALERYRDLSSRVDARHFDLNPIGVYEAMAEEDSPFDYCPFAYGYTNYARRGYARRPLRFGNPVTLHGASLRSTLGGTGLAVSSRCAEPEWATRYAAFCASPATQCGLFVQSGGQPGHRAAWLDEEANRLCGDFFRDTLATHDAAYLRPRYPGYLRFQDHGGAPIREWLMRGGDAGKVLEQLNRLYRESLPS